MKLGFRTHRLNISTVNCERETTDKYLSVINIGECSDDEEVFYIIPMYPIEYDSFKNNRVSVDYNRLVIANGLYIKV